MTDDQLTRDDLTTMTPDQITEALSAGRLDRVMGKPEPDIDLIRRAREGDTLSRDDVAALARLGERELILDAHTRGTITY